MERQPFSVGLHESFYLYNWIEATHVLSLMVSLGLLCIIDLRMLGACLTGAPATRIAARLNAPMLIGFGVMFVTGIVLFAAIPVRTNQSLCGMSLWVRSQTALINGSGSRWSRCS
jgi:hypothetical protein